MKLSNNLHLVIGFLTIALVSALAFAANFDKSNGVHECLTKEHVIIAQERSLSGISLVCNEAIRQDNLARQAAAR